MRRPFRSVLVAALVVAALASVGVGQAGGSTGDRRCNGMARLCDRRVGDVAFATSHNSMSSPADHFRGPNQGKSMAWQLAHGIRGFQIDAYEGVDRGSAVFTDLSGLFGIPATDLPAPLVAAALLIHERIGAPPAGTPTEVYLCHTFCEIGAVPFDHEAGVIRAFLDDHPDEVLVVVVEDHVTPDRLHAVLAAHGLDRELVAAEPGAPLPTLGEMIDARTRLLVSLENGDGGSTMPNAFTGLVEETPFTFLRPSALRAAAACATNRGVDGSPVFQLNHWVTPPVRRAALSVNRQRLRDRVERCTAQRGRIPTLVAVDFAEASDVVAVARQLNREHR